MILVILPIMCSALSSSLPLLLQQNLGWAKTKKLHVPNRRVRSRGCLGCYYPHYLSDRQRLRLLQLFTIVDNNSDGDIDLDEFMPKFDGQLICGIEANEKGQIEVTAEELQNKLNRIASSSSSSTSADVSSKHKKKTKSSPKKVKDPESTKTTIISLSSSEEYKRQRSKLNNKIPTISRTVPLGIFKNDIPGGVKEEMTSTVWELENPTNLVQNWMEQKSDNVMTVTEQIKDPFGCIMWPGSILASQIMSSQMKDLYVKDKTVLILGAGTGVEAQAAALLGAKKVIATDVNELSLQLLKYGAEKLGLDKVIEAQGK